MKAALLALAGCAGTLSATAPKPFEGWNEVQSPHFQLWIHGSVERGEALVKDMEDLRRVVIGSAFYTFDARSRAIVVAFADPDEVAQFIPKQFVAYSWAWTPAWRPLIVISADAEERDRRILTHELTHVISHGVIGVQPRWFAEGLAGYFETIRLEHGKAELGAPTDDKARAIHERELMPVADAFACREAACETHSFYATAWALYAFLMNQHRTALAHYMQTLIALEHDQDAPAWDAVVPELPTAALQQELGHWLRKGSIEVARYDVAPMPVATTHRALGAGDIHAARGLVKLLTVKDQGEITDALAAEPTNLVANLIARWGDASAVAAAHPDDWRAWWLVGVHGDRSIARERLCAAWATDPDGGAPPKQLACQSATGAPR